MSADVDQVGEYVEITLRVRASQLAAIAAIFRAPVALAMPPAPSGSLVKAELAKALRVSLATVDRLVREGMPCELVGARRRFDLEACRVWLAARGRKSTASPAPRAEDDSIDVTRVTRRAGLRVVKAPAVNRAA